AEKVDPEPVRLAGSEDGVRMVGAARGHPGAPGRRSARGAGVVGVTPRAMTATAWDRARLVPTASEAVAASDVEAVHAFCAAHPEIEAGYLCSVEAQPNAWTGPRRALQLA